MIKCQQMLRASFNTYWYVRMLSRMSEYRIRSSDELVSFGQLYGMCDQVSFSLGKFTNTSLTCLELVICLCVITFLLYRPDYFTRPHLRANDDWLLFQVKLDTQSSSTCLTVRWRKSYRTSVDVRPSTKAFWPRWRKRNAFGVRN